MQAAPNSTLSEPLRFDSLLFAKVWGGRGLAKLGKALPAAGGIGESWELADLPQTSAGGAGGGEARSRIATGAHSGRTLGELIGTSGETRHGLLGSAQPSEDGGFPLLIKYLDASENLSVQVHPSPRYASEHPECKLKTECWYILDAAPGAVIYKGLKPGAHARLAQAIANGSIVNDLIAVPAITGECHNLPSGTLHALGAGVLVAEVQTPSDTTFRVYDWGRTGRELHVAQALECIDAAAPPVTSRMPSGQVETRLVDTEYFTLDELHIGAGAKVEAAAHHTCDVLMVVRGGGALHDVRSKPALPMELKLGQTVLVPHNALAHWRFVATDPTVLLRARPK